MAAASGPTGSPPVRQPPASVKAPAPSPAKATAKNPAPPLACEDNDSSPWLPPVKKGYDILTCGPRAYDRSTIDKKTLRSLLGEYQETVRAYEAIIPQDIKTRREMLKCASGYDKQADPKKGTITPEKLPQYNSSLSIEDPTHIKPPKNNDEASAIALNLKSHRSKLTGENVTPENSRRALDVIRSLQFKQGASEATLTRLNCIVGDLELKVGISKK